MGDCLMVAWKLSTRLDNPGIAWPICECLADRRSTGGARALFREWQRRDRLALPCRRALCGRRHGTCLAARVDLAVATVVHYSISLAGALASLDSLDSLGSMWRLCAKGSRRRLPVRITVLVSLRGR